MTIPTAASAGIEARQEDRFLHLKHVQVDFVKGRPEHTVHVQIKVDNQTYESPPIPKDLPICWECEIYISSLSRISISIHRQQTKSKKLFTRKPYAQLSSSLCDVEDGSTHVDVDSRKHLQVSLTVGQSIQLKEAVKLLGEGASSALAGKVILLDKIGRTSGFIEVVLKIAAPFAELNFVAKAVFSLTQSAFESLQRQRECHEIAIDLARTLHAKLPISQIIPERMQNDQIRTSLHALLEVVREAFVFLNNYASASASHDLLFSRQETIKYIKDRLGVASENFAQSLLAHQYVMAVQNKERQDIGVLDKLRPVLSARQSKGRSCLEGTRTSSRHRIIAWSEMVDLCTKLFWVYGFAGSGKSSIAATICELLEAKGVLAGSFFCKSDIPDQRDSGRILPSLAYTLALMYKAYRDCLISALEKEPDISNRPLSFQLTTLFITPFDELARQGISREKPLIFVIDALNECGSNHDERSQLADIIYQVAGLVDWLKIIVTSRPLPEPFEKFKFQQASIVTLYDLSTDVPEAEATQDIFLYMQHSLDRLVKEGKLDEKWRKGDVADKLAHKSSGLFIWASTMIEYVRSRLLRDKAMQMILDSKASNKPELVLDELYTRVLQNIDVLPESENLLIITRVLGIIRITSRNRPLSIEALHTFILQLDGLVDLTMMDLKSIIKDLRSVLYEDASRDNVVRVLHQSFLDFLSNERRCGQYWVDTGQLNQTMIVKSFDSMQLMLKFNICDLILSCKANGCISDLQQRIKKKIPESLQYSCLYWVTHLTGVNRATVDQLVAEFFGGLQILYWLEVLSLIGGLKRGLDALEAIANIFKDRTRLHEIAWDAHRFLSANYDAISYCTPHLYISAMTWLPQKSPLRLLLYPHFENPSLLTAGRHKEWHRAQWMNAMGGYVGLVAFSSDGRNVAACSDDETVCIWEARTGLMVTKLKGNTASVRGIAFSPDGRQLASGSEDNTVRILDVDSGLAVGDPMTAHTNVVISVCYSPDGMSIASRSFDATVRIWDLNTRKEVRKLVGYSDKGCVVYSPNGREIACCGREGIIVYSTESEELFHEVNWVGHVLCVAYSPSGTYLASGGKDSTVRLWDRQTLVQVAVLIGHVAQVYSVAFSPNDSELLSASADATLIRWDMESFQKIGRTFRAHETTICSAAYSPNGRFIASGSEDNTIRLWDVETISDAEAFSSLLSRVLAVACSSNGKEFASATADGSVRIHDTHSGAVLRTLIGHFDEVNAVAYSRDSMLLASACSDCDIIVWNAETSIELHKLQGHNRRVNSVVFLPDGKHIISASDDNTVRRWHVSSGDGEVILRHADKVNAVCLSPNGKLLVSGGKEKTIYFSDPEFGIEAGQPCTSNATIRALAFSSNGKYIASGSEDDSIQIWDIGTRTAMRSLEGHTKFVLFVAFSLDGMQLISSSGDGTVRQWDVETGSELRKLTGHTDTIRHAVYSVDGKRVISGSFDGTVRIWNTDVTQKGFVAEIDQELPSLSLADGWIKSREGDLMLWVPPEYRNGIRDMCEVCIPADAPGHPVRIDWSKLVKGESWTNVLKIGS